MNENVFLLMLDRRPVGAYTNHRKAMQELLQRTLKQGFTLSEYLFDFGVEWFTYKDGDGDEIRYAIYEMEPDVADF